MSQYYGVMATQYAEFLHSINGGSGARYNDNKLTLVSITDAQIAAFDGEVVRLDLLELTNEQLTALVDSMIAAEATGKLIIISISQGRLLHKIHPAFREKEVVVLA